jgi:hypothetical protein
MNYQSRIFGKASPASLTLDSFFDLNTMSRTTQTLVKQTQRNAFYSMGMKKTATLFAVILSTMTLTGCSVLEASVSSPRSITENQSDKIVKTLQGPLMRFPHKQSMRQDPALDLYRDTHSRSSVLSFYSRLTGSTQIARTILDASDKEGIAPSLAFSVAWAESGFQTRNVSFNPGSVDRGLFQLNSKTFANLNEKDFFDPKVNASHGLRYLDYCLSYGEDEIVALALYNAGLPRIQKGAVPRSTYGYIERVLSYKADLDKRFGDEVVSRWLPRSDY